MRGIVPVAGTMTNEINDDSLLLQRPPISVRNKPTRVVSDRLMSQREVLRIPLSVWFVVLFACLFALANLVEESSWAHFSQGFPWEFYAGSDVMPDQFFVMSFLANAAIGVIGIALLVWRSSRNQNVIRSLLAVTLMLEMASLSRSFVANGEHAYFYYSRDLDPRWLPQDFWVQLIVGILFSAAIIALTHRGTQGRSLSADFARQKPHRERRASEPAASPLLIPMDF